MYPTYGARGPWRCRDLLVLSLDYSTHFFIWRYHPRTYDPILLKICEACMALCGWLLDDQRNIAVLWFSCGLAHWQGTLYYRMLRTALRGKCTDLEGACKAGHNS